MIRGPRHYRLLRPETIRRAQDLALAAILVFTLGVAAAWANATGPASGQGSDMGSDPGYTDAQPAVRITTMDADVCPAQAGYDCRTPYDVACRRMWRDDAPDLLARWLSPQGDYMGSLRLDGQSDADADDACNQRFSECQGRCFGR